MRRVRLLISILFFLLPLTPSTPFAARPLSTEDAGTVDRGTFELELAFDYLRGEERDKYYFPSAQLKYGPLERMEIGASLGYIFRDVPEGNRVDGWSDLYTYLKYRIWEEGEYYPAFTLKPLIKFPTASWKNDLGSGKTDYALGAIFSKSISDLKLHFDAFYFFIGEEGEMDILSTGLALEYEFAKGWTAVGELRYLDNFNSDRKDDPFFINVGLKKEVGPAVFDLAVNAGLNNAAPDYGFTVGVTLRFK